MVARLSFVPASPAVGDGILLTVEGEVQPDGAVIVYDSASPHKVHAKSVVFSQEDRPAGTGPQAFSVDIDATSGDFALYLYTDDEGFTTDDIYYYNDGPPNYLYPDGDEVADAINDALGDGADTTVRKIGGQLIVLVGGKWSGKDDLTMNGIATGLVGGAGTVTINEIDAPGGPFVFGPIQLPAGSYRADVNIESGVDAGDSVLSGTKAITVT